MFKRLSQFLSEIKTELKERTTWPSKDDVLSSTVVVSVSILFVSIALYLVDLGVSKVIRFIVVEKVALLKTYVSNFTFLLFILSSLLFVLIYSRIKAKLKR